MTLVKLIELILYICLLVCAIYFVHQSIREFSEHKTSFDISQAALSLNDVPTITLCFDYLGAGLGYYNVSWTELNDDLKFLEYGKNISISLGSDINENTMLDENKTVLFGSKGVKSKLKIRLTKFWTEYYYYQPCYKISTEKNDEIINDFQRFEIGIEIKFLKHFIEPPKIKLTLTSEDNSYGWTWFRWFDGNVDILKVDINKIATVKIREVTEYSYISSICSNDSYYKCLAKRFENFDFSSYLKTSGDHWMKTNCPSNITCSPVSLPFSEERIPICQDSDLIQCYLNVLQKLKSDQEQHCKEACHAKEFKAEVEYWNQNGFNGFNTGINGSRLNVQFKLPIATKVMRSSQPLKTMKKEYFVLSWMSLFGNVGGTLGMFIGFSFLTSTEWIMLWVEKLWRYTCNKNDKKGRFF